MNGYHVDWVGAIAAGVVAVIAFSLSKIAFPRLAGVSPHQAVAVAIRIFAAWLGITVIRGLASFAFIRQSDMPGYAFAVAVLVLAALLVAALWLFPGIIAGKLLSPTNAKLETSASPDLWLEMGCALLGLWLLTSALPTLIFDTYALLRLNPGDDRGNVPQSVVYYVVEVAIGLWLVFGAKGFRRLFWWARNAGYKKIV